jgi:hypothetical protein
VSGVVHAAALAGSVWIGAIVPPASEGLGAGEADMGGTAAVVAEWEPDESDELPRARLVSIGVVADEAPQPAAPAPPAAPASPPAPVPPVPTAEPAAAAPRVAPAPAEVAVAEATPVPSAPEEARPEEAEAPQETEAAGEADVGEAEGAEAVVAAEPAGPAETATENPHQQGRPFQPNGRRPPGRGKRHVCPHPEDDGVERTSPDQWTVRREVVEHYANNLPELMKLGSVRAHRTPEGKLRGFRVSLARCSILRATGVRSGDIVQTINGIEVHDVFGAVGAYFRLRKESHIEVRIKRRDREITLRYELT